MGMQVSQGCDVGRPVLVGGAGNGAGAELTHPCSPVPADDCAHPPWPRPVHNTPPLLLANLEGELVTWHPIHAGPQRGALQLYAVRAVAVHLGRVGHACRAQQQQQG